MTLDLLLIFTAFLFVEFSSLLYDLVDPLLELDEELVLELDFIGFLLR